MIKQGNSIPRNKCQYCYKKTGRYFLDCSCLICDSCTSQQKRKIAKGKCSGCQQNTNGKYIDFQKKQSANKEIGHLFEDCDIYFQKTMESYKFQKQIAFSYVRFLERQTANYRKAIGEVLEHNPHLREYISMKMRSQQDSQSQIKSNNSKYIRQNNIYGGPSMEQISEESKRQNSRLSNRSHSPQSFNEIKIGQSFNYSTAMRNVSKNSRDTDSFSGKYSSRREF